MATTSDIKVKIDLEVLTEHVRQIVYSALDEQTRDSTVEITGTPNDDEGYARADDLLAGGFVQEANRLFFHPLKMALEADAERNEFRIQITHDPAGFEFSDEIINSPRARINAKNVALNLQRFATKRLPELGYLVQPVPGFEPLRFEWPDDIAGVVQCEADKMDALMSEYFDWETEPTPTSPERFGPWVSGARLTEAETRAAAEGESTSQHYGVALACKAFIDGELWTDANGKLLKSAPTQQVEESTTHVKEPDKQRLYGQECDENMFFEIEGWLDDNAGWLEDMKPVDLILLEHEVADPRSHFPGAESIVEMMMDYAYNWGEVTEVVEWDKENTQVLAAAEAFAQAIADTQTGRMAGKVVARHRWNGNGFEKVDDND